MPRRPALTLGALALAVPVLAVPLTADAVVGTTSFTFTGCDKEKNYLPFGNATSLTTPVTVDTASPVPVDTYQTVAITLGSLPAGTFPDDLDETDIGVDITFADGKGGTFGVAASRTVASFDADAPLVIGQVEKSDQYYSYSGFYDYRPKQVQVSVYGYTPGGDLNYYTYTCDQEPNPPSVVTVGVFDPAADAQLVVDRLSARQGGAFVVSGTDFAPEAADDPDGDVLVTLGGVVVGSFDVDETGAFRGIARVPEFAKPGAAVLVRATESGEVAASTLRVGVKKSVAKASPRVVKPGKKVSIKGSSFKPGETVKITLSTARGAGKRAFATSVKVKANGSFTRSVTLKRAAKGAWKVTVKGPRSYRSAKAGFRVR